MSICKLIRNRLNITACQDYMKGVNKMNQKMVTENITKAIEGLTAYMAAISEMDADEFDYCYNKLMRQGMEHFKIEKYITALKTGRIE